jgi:hypothetical protein
MEEEAAAAQEADTGSSGSLDLANAAAAAATVESLRRQLDSTRRLAEERAQVGGCSVGARAAHRQLQRSPAHVMSSTVPCWLPVPCEVHM